MFKTTVKIDANGDRCELLCRFLRDDKRPECVLFGRRLSIISGGYLLPAYLRCADCKKAEKATEKGNA